MVVYVIGSMISYLSNEEPVDANQWISLFLFFCLCGVSVPLTGYYGAREKDANKLQMFAFGEGCVSCCSFMTILSTFYVSFFANKTKPAVSRTKFAFAVTNFSFSLFFISFVPVFNLIF